MKVKIIESHDRNIFEDKLALFLTNLEEIKAHVVDIQYQLRPIPNFSQGQTTFLYSAMVVWEPFQNSAIPPESLDILSEEQRVPGTGESSD